MDIKAYIDPGIVGHKDPDGLIINGGFYEVKTSYPDQYGLHAHASQEVLEYIGRAVAAYQKSIGEWPQGEIL